ncbi:hypothetical protein Scep_020802 [Stephania cephalantha]|uniref:Uncharacterized protein n=1 Tax=Stephania cephalantha TaxID=152367 RepID=A0AAP0IDV3_9MAGN
MAVERMITCWDRDTARLYGSGIGEFSAMGESLMSNAAWRMNRSPEKESIDSLPIGWILGAMIYFTASSGSSPGWPIAPGKRIEEAFDSFMHALLGSGDIARLVELRSCNWVVAITGWMSR